MYASTTTAPKTVSIVIPCFNESEGLVHLQQEITPILMDLRRHYQVELVLVNDGSSDDTYQKMHTIFGNQAVILSHPKNRGIFAAMRTGFEGSKGEIICTLDSDCTFHPRNLAALLDLMQDDVDVVSGSHYHPQGRILNVPGWRIFLSKTLSLMYSLVLQTNLYTYTGCFRAYRREVLEKTVVINNGFLGVGEVLIEALLLGYRVVELPTELSCRQFGQSKMRILQVIISHLDYLKSLIGRRFFASKARRAVVSPTNKNTNTLGET